MTNDERHAIKKDAYQRYLVRNTDRDKDADWLEAENAWVASRLSEKAQELLILGDLAHKLDRESRAAASFANEYRFSPTQTSVRDLIDAGLGTPVQEPFQSLDCSLTEKGHAAADALISGFLDKVHTDIVASGDVHLWGLRRRDLSHVEYDLIWKKWAYFSWHPDIGGFACLAKRNDPCAIWPTEFALLVKPDRHAHVRLGIAFHEEGHYIETEEFLRTGTVPDAIVESKAEKHAIDKIVRCVSEDQWTRAFCLFSLRDRFRTYYGWATDPKIGSEYREAVPLICESEEFRNAVKFAKLAKFPTPQVEEIQNILSAPVIQRPSLSCGVCSGLIDPKTVPDCHHCGRPTCGWGIPAISPRL